MEKVEPLIEKLNSETQNEYKFMLKSAVLEKGADFCVIEIFYRDGIILSKQLKAELENKVLNMLPKSYTYQINFVKNYISTERIASNFNDFMKKNYQSICFKLLSVNQNDLTFNISFEVDKLSFDHAKSVNLGEKIQKHLKNLYEDYDFVCTYTSADVYQVDELQQIKENYKPEKEPDMSSLRVIDFTDQIPLVGEEIIGPASYIKDKTKPENNIVFCGTIKSIRAVVIKRKPKTTKNENQNSQEIQGESSQNDETQEENPLAETAQNDAINDKPEPKYEKKLYKFELADFTGSVQCVYFSNKETQAKLEKLEAGSEIVISGNLQEDSYSNGLSFMVNKLGYCTFDKDLQEVIVYHKEKPFYEFVTPEKIVTYTQDNLLNFAEEKSVPAYLQNKTFVCYDFETTGLHFDAGDKIIEIGAVKIVDGKITEKFLSYVDPERNIPADATEISGITDEDVAGAPKDYEILQDFYKFTRGAILIGYNNIIFDNVFLIGQGRNCRWNFDNETEDVYRLAQKYVHGVKNYKLGTIAAKLGVTLDNAHRAVFDALATAEVFIKIAELIKQ